jgi:hypothetical protein
LLVRLERDFVAQRRAADLQRRGAGHAPPQAPLRHVVERPPGAPVEARQHRPAEIQRALRRRLAPGQVEAHAQRDAVVERERGDAPHLHVARKAAAPQCVVGQTPQRRDARKQQKQRRHHGRAQ